MDISVQSGRFAIVRLEPTTEEPEWARSDTPFVSITRTEDELSLICSDTQVPESLPCSRGWACLKVAGPMDLFSVGILAGLAECLRDGGVSMFAVSTYDTDYVLVPGDDLARALAALREAGHRVVE
jgi:hypothetical protein